MEASCELGQTNQYPELFRFIPKNIALQQKIDEIGAFIDLSSLMEEIAKGSYESALLQHPDAPYAFLKLFQMGKIDSTQDLTLFLYGLAAKSDRAFKTIRAKPMFEQSGNLTEYAKTYIEDCVQPYFLRMQKDCNLSELRACLWALPTSEQFFFELDFLPNTDFTEVLRKVRHFMGPIVAIARYTRTAILPSIGFLHSIFNLVQEAPVSLYGFFGTIQPYTRHRLMRTERRVPLARFEAFVKHNLTEAHGWIRCPFTIAFHDLLHWYWCNLLTRSEREDIFSYTDVLAQYYLEASASLMSKAPVFVHLGKRVLETLWDFEIGFTQSHPENRAKEYLEEQAKSLSEYPVFQDWHPLQEALKWEKMYRNLAKKSPDPELFCKIFPYREGLLDAYRTSLNLAPGSEIPQDASPDSTLVTECFKQVCEIAEQYDSVWLVFWFLTSHALPHEHHIFLEFLQEHISTYSTLSQVNAINFSPLTILPNQQDYMETLTIALETCKDVLADETFCCEILKLTDRYQEASNTSHYGIVGRILRLILHAGIIHEQDFPRLAQIIERHVKIGIQNQMGQRKIFSLIPSYLNPEQLHFWKYFFQKYPTALSWEKLREKIEKAARAYDAQELINLLTPPGPKVVSRFFSVPILAIPEDTANCPALS